MSLDKATVQKIAVLARIAVPENALEPMAQELSGILGWIEQLQEVDTDAVAPMSGGTDLKLPWRADAVNDGGYADKIVANAPDGVADEVEDGKGAFFAVPKVVE